MEVLHAFPQIKPMGIFPQLVAGNFYLHTARFLCQITGVCEHFAADTVASGVFIYGKFHDFRHKSGVVELSFHAKMKDAFHLLFLFPYQKDMAAVCQHFPIHLGKSILWQFLFLHITNQFINATAVLCLSFSDYATPPFLPKTHGKPYQIMIE